MLILSFLRHNVYFVDTYNFFTSLPPPHRLWGPTSFLSNGCTEPEISSQNLVTEHHSQSAEPILHHYRLLFAFMTNMNFEKLSTFNFPLIRFKESLKENILKRMESS